MASVRVDALTKKFGDREVVNRVSFQVADGAFAVMLGPSGSGKTTLLRCIAGLELPDSGSVYVGDVLMDELSPRERDLSMVFQNYSLFPHMSVKANLAFPLVVRHRPRGEVEERVRRTAELLRIEQHLDKRPNQLSGGEQQRVSLGRAIIREPRAFLMDEPLSGLDAPLKLQMRAELKRVQRETKLTTIYVTHDQVEGMGLAGVLGVMNEGELIQYDAPAEVYARPRNAFVAGFVGNPPASLLEAEVREENGNLELRGDGFTYRVGEDLARALKGNTDRVIIGVKPEGVKLVRAQRAPNDIDGVTATGSWQRPDRAARYRVPGWGDVEWKRVMTALLEQGYDYVLSFEHEDPVMSEEDGCEQCIRFLKPLIIKKPLGPDSTAWWLA